MLLLIFDVPEIVLKYSDTKSCADSFGSDQSVVPRGAVLSGLHCLPLSYALFMYHSTASLPRSFVER